MAAGGFRTFVAGEVLDEDDINNFLMQGVLVFADGTARDAAITSPVEGQFAFLTGSNVLTFYDGAAWVEYEAGLFAATVTSTTGSPTTGTFTDSNGFEWDYYEFTGNGSITVGEAGYADCLVVGGGGGGKTASTSGRVNNAGGGAGAVRFGAVYLSAAEIAVTVGAGGAGSTNASFLAASGGSPSSLGSVVRAGGGASGLGFSEAVSQADISFDGGGGSPGGVSISTTTSYSNFGSGAGGVTNNYDGITLDYNDSSVEYGKGGISTAPTANTGGGGASTGGTGADGVVIVKVLR